MKIDAPISRDALNARLREGREADAVTFETAPIADLTLTRTHGGVLVKGIISGICKQDCASCGDLVPHEAQAVIDWILQGDAERAAHDDDLDDPGVIVYQGEHVDLEEHLQEALILSLSPFWHPPRDKHDRCSVCNRNCSRKLWTTDDNHNDDHGDDDDRAKELKQSEGRSSLGPLLKTALKKVR
jgi:uncharacterized metal-binding protein YceD (DUF177 family)